MFNPRQTPPLTSLSPSSYHHMTTLPGSKLDEPCSEPLQPCSSFASYICFRDSGDDTAFASMTGRTEPDCVLRIRSIQPSGAPDSNSRRGICESWCSDLVFFFLDSVTQVFRSFHTTTVRLSILIHCTSHPTKTTNHIVQYY